MRQSFKQADFQALASLWNEFYPAEYAVDAELLEINTVRSSVFDWGLSQIEVDERGEVQAFVSFKRSAASLFKGPSVDQAHLSAIAYRDPRLAVDLVADAKRILRNRGVNRLHFGADSRHFWPGCPVDCGAMCGFLMVEGFEDQGEVFDLERDISNYRLPQAAPDDFEYRPLQSEDDVVALRVFFEAQFPGRWMHDTLEKIDVDGPGCVYCAVRDQKVYGFALLQRSVDNLPIGGAVWRNALGENWGSLGPIGIAKELRGNGLGHGLLGKALEHLRDSGVRRCIIDWTTLDAFYGRHGFEITRRYRPSQLRISD